MLPLCVRGRYKTLTLSGKIICRSVIGPPRMPEVGPDPGLIKASGEIKLGVDCGTSVGLERRGVAESVGEERGTFAFGGEGITSGGFVRNCLGICEQHGEDGEDTREQ